jgi:hypothetical protein
MLDLYAKKVCRINRGESDMAKANKHSTRVTLVFFLIIAEICVLSQLALPMPFAGQDQTRLRLVTASQNETEALRDSVAILAAARVIYVRSRTVFVKSEVIENELLKRADFQQAGLQITKDPRAADLIMEVRRSNLTIEYPYVVVDARTRLVVASGKVNSLFGTAAGKIAKGFVKQVQKARTPAGGKPTK